MPQKPKDRGLFLDRFSDSGYDDFASDSDHRGIDADLSTLHSTQLGDDYVPARRKQVPVEQTAVMPVARKGNQSYHAPRHAAHAAPSSLQDDDGLDSPNDYVDAFIAANCVQESGFSNQRVVKSHVGRNIAIGVLAIVAVLLLAVAIYSLWFTSQLNNALDRTAVTPELTQVLEQANPENGPFYVLVLGSDSREGSGTSEAEDESGDNERSDVMMLVRVDLSKRLITLVSIPRDTPYRLDDGSLVKINELYNMGGAAASIKAVSELTGLPISHYVEVRFSDLQQIVDALGGVTVDVPMDLEYMDALTGEWVVVPAGRQTLDGQQAQIFARARHEYANAYGQDAGRQNSVRTLAVAIMKETLDRPLAELPETILELAQYVGTDMRASDFVSMGFALVTGSGELTVYSGTGPTEGEVNEDEGIWLCYENPEGWEELVAVVDAGGDPEGMDFTDTQIPW